MSRLFLTALLIIISITIAQSQDAFYKHFEGNVGTNIQIVADLVRSGEKLSGYYYYFFDDQSGDTSWTHYGKSMPIFGTLTSDQFEFSEFDPEVKGAVFKGTFDGSTLTGTWNSADGNKQLPFVLKENYPRGTMPFIAIYMNQSGTLFDKKPNPKATIEVSILLPGKYTPQNVADSIRANIYDHCFDVRNDSSSVEVLLNSLKDMYLSNYRSSNADLYQEGAASFDWEKQKEVRILHNEKEVLSIEFYDYGFTGGAHGLSLTNFHVFDLKDGHLVTLEEVFRDDYTNDLRDIINSAARKKYHLQRNQPMTDAGFFVEYLDPTPNFYITKDGMGFFYNQYEVAPFALGPIEIFVSYSDLVRILREDSPVYRVISK